MFVKDRQGNIISEGDFVHVKLDDPWITGRIKTITEGGQILQPPKPGQPGIRSAGKILIEVEVLSAFHPDQPIAQDVVKIYDPREVHNNAGASA